MRSSFGMPESTSLALMSATEPPCTIRYVRRKALRKFFVECAAPRYDPFELYAQYGFHWPFISA